MKIKVLLFAALSYFWFGKLQAQCDVRYPEIPIQVADIDYSNVRSNDTLFIPTIFHVYFNDLLAPIDAITVQAELDACNERLLAINSDLSDIAPEFVSLVGSTKIQLELAKKLPDGSCTSGIIYHDYDAEAGPITFAQTINSFQYLNIHVVPSNTSFTILPGPATTENVLDDCIVLIPPHLLNQDDVLVHEVGHWLGLYHTFGPTNSTGTPCGEDFIADTPPTAGSNINPCNLQMQDCQPGVVENVNNFMDYSNCRSMFTIGQTQRMRSVMLDSTLNRFNLHQEANLLATGVIDPPQCDRSITIQKVQFVNCDSTQVNFSFIAENAIPDSVVWEFVGASISSSTAQMPIIYYYSENSYQVKLYSFYGNEVDTVIQQIPVDLNSPNNNLPQINSFPYLVDFEGGFTLPNEHMYTSGLPNYTWQLNTQTGYNSEQCLFVPAKDNVVSDTVELFLGTFNMTSLENPTLSFKVASSLPPLSVYHQLEVRFKDDCNSLIIGNLWAILGLVDMFNGNTNENFIPSSDEQWYNAVYNFPSWSSSGHATISLRLITSPSAVGVQPTAYFLDDFRIGEPEIITSTNEIDENDFYLFPNPASDQLSVKHTSNKPESFKIFSPIGSLVHEGTIDNNNSISLQHLNAGVYLIQINNTIKRFVKVLP
jgi:PKD repeat protein